LDFQRAPAERIGIRMYQNMVNAPNVFTSAFKISISKFALKETDLFSYIRVFMTEYCFADPRKYLACLFEPVWASSSYRSGVTWHSVNAATVFNVLSK